MSENGQEEATENQICFDEVLDITLVFQYYEKFNQILNSHKTVTIDAEKVTKVDGAGLQLLATFIQSAQRLNVEVTWAGVSDDFKKSAALIGLSEQLGY